VTFNEFVVALVAIIGGLSGAVGVLVRALITAKDQHIKELERELDAVRLQSVRQRSPLDRRRGEHHADHDPEGGTNGHE
jgi:hypothetical protein